VPSNQKCQSTAGIPENGGTIHKNVKIVSLICCKSQTQNINNFQGRCQILISNQKHKTALFTHGVICSGDITGTANIPKQSQSAVRYARDWIGYSQLLGIHVHYRQAAENNHGKST